MQPITEPQPNEQQPARSVPPPLRKHHFDRAAPFLNKALLAFPQVVAFYPTVVTPETFARCLRQGIEAKRRYRYTHAELDDELFARHGGALSIAVRYPMTQNHYEPMKPAKPAVIVGGRAEVKAFVL